MSALEDSLRAVYKLPQVGTSARGIDYGSGPTAAASTFLQKAQEQPELQNTPEFQVATAMTEQPEFTQEDQETLDRLLKQEAALESAPLGPLAQELRAQGLEEDTELAHVRLGEVILPPEFLDDDKFATTVENKFKAEGINPEEAVVGGIGTLNPGTGLQQFFLKKLAKGLKKVVKKVAPYAGLIAAPFTGGASAALIGGIGGAIGGGGIKGALKGAALGGAGSALFGGAAGAGAGKGIGGFFSRAKEFILPGTDKVGLFGNIRKGIGSFLGGGQQVTVQPGDTLSQIAQANNTTVDAILAANPGITDPNLIQAGASLNIPGGGFMSSPVFNPATGQMTGGGFGGRAAEFILPGQDQRGLLANLGLTGGAGGAGGAGGGFGNFAKLAGIGALSAGLGKLAYEDAQKQKGVALTPLTTMSPTGRYNIEAEIARRMGQARPNPVEFGLLPEGTLPVLSGGQPRQAALGGAIEELEGGMARGMQEGGEMANRDAAKGAPPELLPKIAENVVKSLSERNVASFTDEDVTVEIMKQLRPYTGNLITRSEVDAVRSMMNQMYAPKSQGIGSIMSMMGRSMMGRTPVMGFAQGGAVAMQEGGELDPGSFPRMDGDINGPGTEQSDDIPAMLSDGEFVMTARAVRGAGSYEMKTEPGGIINLVPSLEEDRERGMDVMYKVMDTFSGQAQPS